MPKPVALRLLLLVAITDVSGAVWVLQFVYAAGNARSLPFPVLAFLPSCCLRA